ncbi:substrate-binding periplasmic protein [Azospirillum griseum]|uniref:Transporter substrate-binding domain-containing protein n=1 Tax=Azospirillum griseum TaxID=2496639 RepID=A0A3S0L1L0_9PROT|nr:transporter substrate-binding domain-containing protein [Azospirillum griseum]RTR24455.1 transporter substrate-binding domain-containing protein [Azospirillum griseum]
MTKWLVLLLGLAFTAPAHSQTVVRVGYFDYPPTIATDKAGKPYGPLVEIWEKHLAPRGGFTVQWVGPEPFARLLDSARKGDIDAWCQLFPNKERREWFDFPTIPIGSFNQVIWVRQDNPMTEITSVDDIKGKPIGKLLAGFLPPFMEDNIGSLVLQEHGGSDAPVVAVRKLLLDRLWGLYFVYGDSIRYAAAKEGVLDRIKALPIRIGDPDQPIYTAMHRGIAADKKAMILKALEASQGAYSYKALADDFIAHAKEHIGR